MIEVWSVQFEGEPFVLWKTKENALDYAAEGVIERMDEDDEECLRNLFGDETTDQKVVDWWNDNREPKVKVKRHTVLSKR